MESKTAQGCANCKHWSPGAKNYGLCKRFPPTSVAGALAGQFPVTKGNQSCGEHTARTPLTVRGARVGHFPMRSGVVLVRMMILQALLVCGLLIAPPTIHSGEHDARPGIEATPTARRPMFDLIVVSGATYAYLEPFSGVERITEGVQLMGHAVGWTGDPGDIAFRVDPETDYTATAVLLVVTPDDDNDWQLHEERTYFHFELYRSRLTILDFVVYMRLLWDRALAAMDYSDAELARAISRMNARLDSEGDSDD